jgi:Protein of unknown function (DUF3604)
MCMFDNVPEGQMRKVFLRHRFALATLATLVAGSLPASAQDNPDRNAYFGETHVHTSWSFDAYIFGNTLTGPADA